MARPTDPPPWEELVDIAAGHGITRLGVAPVAVLQRARTELHRRKGAGLHAEMEFTYRNPDRSTDPTRVLPAAKSVIVAARSYLADHEPERPDGVQARVARYAWVDHYAPLRAGLRALADRLKQSGHRAVPLADDNSLVDREVAHLGGIGWFGKNANLLVPGAGSWFVLGSVVTSAEYPVGSPVDDGCGACRRCLDGCPTAAIIEPGVVDANRCLAWLLQRPGSFPVEFRRALGDRLYGCDDCQEVCPPTVRFGGRHRVHLTSAADDVDQRPVEAWVDVLDLLDAADATLLDRHGRWYIPGRDPRWVRRNALVVLGNVGDGDDDRTRNTIERYRSHADPILREHAVWAAEQLGITDSAEPSCPTALSVIEPA